MKGLSRRWWPLGLLVVGCGAGEPAASLPIADAGFDQLDAWVGRAVVLDGSASFDPDGEALTYTWRLVARPAGSEVELEAGSTAAQMELTPDVRGYYLAELRVATAERSSRSDLVAVEVPNRPPVATAECEGQICERHHGTTVALRGNLSEDPEGDELTFQWYQITDLATCEATCPTLTCEPSDLDAGTIQNADTEAATVTLPGAADAQFVFALEVSDGITTSTDCLAYVATNTPPQFNLAPSVVPPSPQTEGVGFSITCFPSDPDSDDLSVTWLQVSPASPQVLPATIDNATVNVTVPSGALSSDTDFVFDVELFDGAETVRASDGLYPVPTVTVLAP